MTEFPWDDEEWLEVASDRSYLVSTYGRLYDSQRKCLVEPSRNRSTLYKLAWSMRNPNRAWNTRTSDNRYLQAGKLILETFVGPSKSRSVVFLDGNDSNLRLSNLTWGETYLLQRRDQRAAS
jgi:hypothetical protein